MAYQAARDLGTMPAVLNAANEESVNSFLNQKINFLTIIKIVEKVMQLHKKVIQPQLAEIFSADAWAREEVKRFVG